MKALRQRGAYYDKGVKYVFTVTSTCIAVWRRQSNNQSNILQTHYLFFARIIVNSN